MPWAVCAVCSFLSRVKEGGLLLAAPAHCSSSLPQGHVPETPPRPGELGAGRAALVGPGLPLLDRAATQGRAGLGFVPTLQPWVPLALGGSLAPLLASTAEPISLLL